jgi:hypothetical protein
MQPALSDFRPAGQVPLLAQMAQTVIADLASSLAGHPRALRVSADRGAAVDLDLGA